MRVMQQSIEHRCGHRRVAGESRVPLRERKISDFGDDKQSWKLNATSQIFLEPALSRPWRCAVVSCNIKSAADVKRVLIPDCAAF
jgi:hypothetical protein